VIRTDDGYTAEVPSLKGCESWAHTEVEVIDKTVDLLKFYMRMDAGRKIKIDKARREGDFTVYKLVFDKE
jgi:predicted RNase H-like HicB family nuclease